MTYNYCPTITASRGSEFGYWNTYLCRRLSLTELMALQGVKKGMLKYNNISSRSTNGRNWFMCLVCLICNHCCIIEVRLANDSFMFFFS